ncbi:uncharacterized protein LOC111911635 isoform X2 [Lactuca sativa]|uniref:uncharacterized protein LOC111911635 isoform X2 n=1 Tax=Lactuca sativa TaxID=4236 RepID=UPI001C68C03F|nr:uncharacterized protein LOC111911635 isoform X2 [Lactuca sativa]
MSNGFSPVFVIPPSSPPLRYLYLSKLLRVSRASDAFLHLIINQVSILVLQKYEYLVLAWAISEVLSSLAGEDKSNMPSLILPFILDTSKTKLERKYSADECVYGIQIGPPPTDL